MLRHAPALVIVAALALPTAAAGKEVSSMAVCASGGCHTIKDRAALHGFMNGGYETIAPDRAGPFFKVNVRMTHDGEPAGQFTVQYLRAANLLRAGSDLGEIVWTRPAGTTARALRRAARGLRPYPATELGPLSEPSPAPVESPPARVSSPASGGGFPEVGLAGGIAVLIAALAAATLVVQRRRRTV